MKTTFYIQFEGVPSYWNEDKIAKVKARRITIKAPDKTIPRGIVVKMTVDIPEGAFLPFEPSVDITIPLDRTVPIVVSIEEPDEEEDGDE